MEPFDRIYFDTSALINASWPRGNALETIRQRAKDLSIVLCIPAPVNVEASRRFDGPPAAYESSIADRMKQWPIQIIPFPEKSLKEAFSELVVRDAPNRYSDGDFRDTVIYQSVVEHLYRRPARGVFVSDDFGHFIKFATDPAEIAWRQREKINLRFVSLPRSGSLKIVETELEILAQPSEVRAWLSQSEQDARNAVRLSKTFSKTHRR